MAGLNPPVRGLRVDVDLQFEFRPSIGISARSMIVFGMDIRSFRVPLKRSIQQVIAPSFKKNFEAGGRPERWMPLADYTVEVRNSSQPILVRSGLLKRTMSQLNIWTIDTTKAALLDLPPKIWYGKIHQFGNIDNNTPARPFAVLQDDDWDGIEDVFARWLAERAATSRAFNPGTGAL